MKPDLNTVLGGRYRLTHRLAIGGMGEVWSARDEVLHRTVAVKVLKPELKESAAFLARFRAEARHTAALSHPGIAGVFDYGEDESFAFLVMEMVVGQPLSTMLADEPIPPLDVTLSILAQAADALHEAHSMGVIHRDVKPGNLLILRDGTVKVTDFGIATAVDAARLTATGQVIGTAQYMSPEQATGAAVSPASDVYSLAAVGYEMLAGRPPFTGDNPLALAMAHVHDEPPPLPSSVPRGLRALIERALSKDPSDRPRDAATFASELRTFEGSLVTQPVTSPADFSQPQTRLDDLTVAQETLAFQRGTVASTAQMPEGGVAVASPLIIIDDRHVAARHRRRAVIASIGVIAASLLVVGLWISARNGSVPAATGASPTDSSASTAAAATTITATSSLPSSTSATTAAPTTLAPVFVDAVALIDMNKRDATKALEDLGLIVNERVVTGANGPGKGPKDDVVGVEPSGPVAPGSTVTLLLRGKK